LAFPTIFGDLAVVDVPTGHDEVERTAFAIDKRVDFGPAAAATDTDGLIFLAPFAPLAARGAWMIVLSIKCRLSRDFAPGYRKCAFRCRGETID
jgi:hypothetical protein